MLTPSASRCFLVSPSRGDGGGWGASRSQSALHMHVLVCICSNVRQFQEIIGMIQLCYHTNHCSCWPCFVNTEVFLCYKTEKGTLTSPSFGGMGGGALPADDTPKQQNPHCFKCGSGGGVKWDIQLSRSPPPPCGTPTQVCNGCKRAFLLWLYGRGPLVQKSQHFQTPESLSIKI